VLKSTENNNVNNTFSLINLAKAKSDTLFKRLMNSTSDWLSRQKTGQKHFTCVANTRSYFSFCSRSATIRCHVGAASKNRRNASSTSCKVIQVCVSLWAKYQIMSTDRY